MPAETHASHEPPDRDEVLELVKGSLTDILEIDPATITEGASFGDDLGADSLALIELVEALEEELGERSVGFRIDDEDLEDLKTVRDAVDYVMAKLRADGGG
jgi:acyl carrier protein